MKQGVLTFCLLFSFFSFQLVAENSENISRLDIAKELKSIKNALNEIDGTYAEINGKYLSPIVLNMDYKESVENKMKKGDFYFEREDYVSSGSIFYSVVISQEKKTAVWEEALYKLSESLFKSKNYISAARYFEMLITDGGNEKYKTESLKRLIALSYSLGDYGAAKRYYNQFLTIGYDATKDQDLMYFLGKSLFFDNQNVDASKVFVDIAEGAYYYPQSRYFLGLIALKDKKLDEASKYFNDIVDLVNQSSLTDVQIEQKKYYKFSNVYELAVLAVARIAFEQNDLDKAIRYYVMLDKSSEYFAEAYYELCWTYVKKGEYDRAISALRLIKFIAPDSIIAPRAETLEGSLLIKASRYGEAMVLMDSLVEKYTKIQKELSNFDKHSFLISNQEENAAAFLLPYSPIIQSLLKDNRRFSETIKLNKNIEELESEISRATQLENKIDSIVDNENVASLIPPLKGGSASALLLRNKLAALTVRLTELRKSIIWEELSEKEREKYDDLEKQRAKTLGFLETSKISPDHMGEATGYAKTIIQLDEKLHRISMQINSLSTQLEAIMVLHAKEKKLSEDDEKKFLDQLYKERSELQNSIKIAARYHQEIENEKNRLVLGGDLIGKEIILRNDLKKLVKKQNEILSGISGEKEIAEITKLLDEAIQLDDSLADFYLKLNDTTREMIAKIRIAYENERNNLNEYKTELYQIKREIAEMGTLSVYSNIDRVNHIFADIILQADLGKIDVAWEKKDESSSEIMRLKTQRAREIQQLYLDLEDN